ncbi:MAG: NAD(P)H-dependent oxidoreductase [Verrucomicrobiae bacterium]|nr:NAD(P)H-dependent oxidoreductase [Verrucomicrobiae bacterium]
MILVVSGTNRAGGNTRKVADRVLSAFREAQISAELLDLTELPSELFAPDAYETKPAAFGRFARAVLESHGLLVVTPEYQGSLPGALKLFLDMLPAPEAFEGRPVGFVGLSAGGSGGVRPVEHLQQIFSHGRAHLYPERVFLPRVDALLGEDGRFRDARLEERLRRQAKGFAEFVRRLRS